MVLLTAVATWGIGCGDSDDETDGPVPPKDGGKQDVAVTDGSKPTDGSQPDAGKDVTVPTDSSSDAKTDATVSDASQDRNPTDAPATDARTDSASDAGADAKTDAAPDGGQTTDGSTSDGSSTDAQPTDAATDAQPTDAATDAPVTYCSSLSPAATFCADFDTATDYKEGWSSTYFYDSNPVGTSLELYTTDPKSAPNSLLATAPAMGNSTQAQALVQKDFATGGTKFRFAYDFRVLARDPTRLSNLQRMQLGLYPSDWSLSLVLEGTKAYLQEVILGVDGGKSYKDHPLQGIPGTTAWTRIEYTVDLTNSKLSVSFDGANVLLDDAATALVTDKTIAPNAALTPLRLIVGINYQTGPLAETKFLVDNVAAYITP